jgi:hypothetical protein
VAGFSRLSGSTIAGSAAWSTDTSSSTTSLRSTRDLVAARVQDTEASVVTCQSLGNALPLSASLSLRANPPPGTEALTPPPTLTTSVSSRAIYVWSLASAPHGSSLKSRCPCLVLLSLSLSPSLSRCCLPWISTDGKECVAEFKGILWSFLCRERP